ncbi:MAG: LysR family transcriptional regulator [Massiliimalia sp.]|jgi:DNA-binding transcriptional LysR family regulator
MNTFQLSCFLAVAEYLNFSQAAQQLHVTHPAVSQQIQSLEKELNVKLFQRTTRFVKLTEEGKSFLIDAQQIMNISERAKKRYTSAAPDHIETLTLGCSSFPCMFLLSDTLAALRTLHPKLHPRLQVIPFQHIYRMLEDGDLDVVIGFKESSNIKIHALYKEITKAQMVCICPVNHPLSSQKELCINDLKEESLVLFVPPKGARSIAQIQGQMIGTQSPSKFYFCDTAEAIVILVTAGYGISILPDFLVPDTPLISKIPLKDIEQASFGVYYKSMQGNPGIKSFIQCARENFA